MNTQKLAGLAELAGGETPKKRGRRAGWVQKKPKQKRKYVRRNKPASAVAFSDGLALGQTSQAAQNRALEIEELRSELGFMSIALARLSSKISQIKL